VANVKKAINDFNQTWIELEAVYGQTRFVEYPASFIPDRYFHLASQSEDLTWMIQPEKLFIGLIEKWLQSQHE
jgi:hexosaminidase